MISETKFQIVIPPTITPNPPIPMAIIKKFFLSANADLNYLH